MDIEINQVELSDSHLEEFLSLPARIYRNDPHYCATSRRRVTESLRRKDFRNSQSLLLASRNGRPVARVVARWLPAERNRGDESMGMLGFFEALDDAETVQRLFSEAIHRLKSAGAGRIIGPIDGDTWHSYRLNTGPFDAPPFLMEPYNPAYYVGLWERSGFRPLEHYVSKQIEDLPGLAAKFQSANQRVRSRGFTLRTLNLHRFHQELKILYAISRRIFADNFLYSDIGFEDFSALYRGAKSILDEDLCWIGLAPDGRPAGFVFLAPDYFRAVAAMRGRANLLASLRFLLAKGRPDTVNIKTLGVLPEYRRSGLAGALLWQAYQAAIARGYRGANHCLIKEGNPSHGLDRGFGRVIRRYALYEYAG